MAENTVLNKGVGGDTIATDDLTSINGGVVSGVKVQRVKVGFGPDAALQDVDAANGLPVVGAFFPATQPVSGTVALDAASLDALETISVANFPATQPVSGLQFLRPATRYGCSCQRSLTPLADRCCDRNHGRWCPH